MGLRGGQCDNRDTTAERTVTRIATVCRGVAGLTGATHTVMAGMWIGVDKAACVVDAVSHGHITGQRHCTQALPKQCQDQCEVNCDVGHSRHRLPALFDTITRESTPSTGGKVKRRNQVR